MDKVYNKLVRDKIPEIIEGNGEYPVVRYLDDTEYKKALEEKLLEEYKEVLASSNEDRLEELADMIEVIRALAAVENSTLDCIISIANVKEKKRGAFKKKVFLEKVTDKKNN